MMSNIKKSTVFAAAPLIVPACLLMQILENPLKLFGTSNDTDFKGQQEKGSPPVGSQLLAYTALAVLGYLATVRLVPNIQIYMLRKGISGKDLGKRGTETAEKDIPEALGIVPGTIFLVCVIICLVGYAASHPTKLLDVNSALLSICFMLFLGFSDDVLDWPWRYKLLLPSVGSLPLLCCYDGSTSIVVPIQMRPLFMADNHLTLLGKIIRPLGITTNLNGSLLDLGYFYFVYMGLLAVFCTNAINIFAGINGIEAGQSYVIGCAVLIHNCIEILYFSSADAEHQENHLFSIMIMLAFVGVTLGLLHHNWFPASVFVGDTFCYFAGMTFAVVAILGHFSKTLLLFFIPQIINFLYSIPQLFKLVPCPRHRLPRYDPKTKLMHPSTFKCKKSQLKWLQILQTTILCFDMQVDSDSDTVELPNMTVLNLCLQLCGPMSEETLCVVLLLFQVACCAMAFIIRYYVAQFFFDD